MNKTMVKDRQKSINPGMNNDAPEPFKIDTLMSMLFETEFPGNVSACPLMSFK